MTGTGSKSGSPARGRVAALDGLRGVAALVVAVHHALVASSSVLAGVYIGGDPSGVARAFVDTPLWLLWGGREAVFVFFVLSGFVLALPHVRGKVFSAIEYYPARFLRLYLPVWAALAFAAVLLLIFDPQSVGGRTWWLDAHGSPFTLRGTGKDGSLFFAGSFMYFSAIWSLKWEIFFSALLPLYLLMASRGGRPGRLIVLAAALVAIAADVSDYLTFLPIFMLGTVLAYEHEAVVAKFRWLNPTYRAAFFALALLLLAASSYARSLPDGIENALITLGAAGLVLVASLPFGAVPGLLRKRPVNWLGLRSFSLYLVHEPIIVSLVILTDDSLAPVLFVLIAVPAAMLAAEGFYRAIERPAHNFARRVRRGLRDREGAAGESAVAPAGRSSQEGRALLDAWARSLESTPVEQLVESFANTDHIEALRGPSGTDYRLKVSGFWADEKEAWKNDFFLLLTLRPSRGWRRLRFWRANLVAPYAENQLKPLFWVQQTDRRREDG
jgi:peptidoglycan/LPS O-acetylase OafA/YrhL